MSFNWDSNSAMRKLGSNISVSANMGPVSVSKQVSGPHNPQTDAYRACSNCGKHVNYHKDGKCP